MPDIGTGMGLMQMIGMGLAFLAIIALRSRRYGTDLFKSFIWLWTAVCIGLGVFSSVELALPPTEAAPRAALVFVVVAIAAWLGGKALRKHST